MNSDNVNFESENKSLREEVDAAHKANANISQRYEAAKTVILQQKEELEKLKRENGRLLDKIKRV